MLETSRADRGREVELRSAGLDLLKRVERRERLADQRAAIAAGSAEQARPSGDVRDAPVRVELATGDVGERVK